MGAANFHTVNAWSTYVIRDNYFDEDEQVSISRDWRDIKYDIIYAGESKGWYSSDKVFRFGSDYDNAIICKEFNFEYSNSGYDFRVDAYITLNAGYYEHCNLDYRLMLDYIGDDNSPDDILDMMYEDFISHNNCMTLNYGKKLWNDGLRMMQKNNFKKAAQKFIDDIVEECENMCKSLCDENWRVVCRASNGSCFYEKV